MHFSTYHYNLATTRDVHSVFAVRREVTDPLVNPISVGAAAVLAISPAGTYGRLRDESALTRNDMRTGTVFSLNVTLGAQCNIAITV